MSKLEIIQNDKTDKELDIYEGLTNNKKDLWVAAMHKRTLQQAP
jgi:hypothetical protein